MDANKSIAGRTEYDPNGPMQQHLRRTRAVATEFVADRVCPTCEAAIGFGARILVNAAGVAFHAGCEVGS